MVLPKIVVVLQQGRTGGAKVLGVGKLYSRGAHAVMGENAVGGVDQASWVELLGEGVEVWRKRPAAAHSAGLGGLGSTPTLLKILVLS